jgi:hypothetical protein
MNFYTTVVTCTMLGAAICGHTNTKHAIETQSKQSAIEDFYERIEAEYAEHRKAKPVVLSTGYGACGLRAKMGWHKCKP